MKTIKSLVCLFLAIVIVSCSDDEPVVFTGDVSVTLVNKGATQVVEGEAAEFTYDVVLNRSFDTDITLTFNLDKLANYPNVLSITNPVTIAKNQTKGVLKITAKKKADVENVLTEDTNFKIAIKSHTGITNKMVLAADYLITVKKEESFIPLTQAQKELLAHYKSQGIDLAMWIGKIPVKVTVKTAPDGNFAPFDKAETKEYTGITQITLSEKATKEKPLLVMTQNAFGLNEYLQWAFRHETILNTDYWNNPAVPASTAVLKALGDARVTKWKNKEYSFNATVDEIEFKKDGSIVFVRKNGTYDKYTNYLEPLDPKKKNFNAVDFRYEFELWNEFVKLAKSNSKLKEHMEQGGSIHPGNRIPETDALKDEWGGGFWVKPTGTYNNAKKAMNFVFNTDHTNSGDYDTVTVKFTAN